jgi:Flp pilus assembly protein TadD
MKTNPGLLFAPAPARDFAAHRMITPAPPLDYRAHMVIAYRHYLDKNYRLALATYRRVLVDFPTDPTALSGEAWSLYYLGDESRAAADFRRLLYANASDSWARMGLDLCEQRGAE